MGPSAIERAVEARVGNALTDLGRPAVLFALCDGEPSTDALLEAVVASERAAAETFGQWSETARTAELGSNYAAVAAQERAHARLVGSLLEEPAEPAATTPGPLHGYLRGLDSPTVRVGAGLFGRPIASLRTYDRLLEFAESVGDGPFAAGLRELRTDTGETVATGVALLDTLSDDGSPPAGAVAAATYAVRLVHDDYADTLAQLGRSFG